MSRIFPFREIPLSRITQLTSMKTSSFLSRILSLSMVALGSAALLSTASGQVLHEALVKKVEVSMQQTPSFSAGGPKDKRWDPLEWLEIEVELDVDSKSPTKIIPEISATFYLALPNKSADGNVMLTDRMTFVNIRAHKGKAFLIAYVNPDTLTRFTGQEKASKNDILSAGVEIEGPGLSIAKRDKMIGSTRAGAWWKTVNYPREQGMILPKGKTPFSLLWFDRYPQTRDER